MKINIGIAQVNSTVGALSENRKKICNFWKELDENSHLVVFPELALTGYPPEDLLLQKDFLDETLYQLEELKKFSRNLNSVAIIGLPFFDGFSLFNSAVVIKQGNTLGIYHKHYLPNYSVFDEKRYFFPGDTPVILELNFCKIGISICEDIWHPEGLERLYALSGAEILLNINASPYYTGKSEFKLNFLKARAEDNLAYLVYVNLTGAQDELVFDGRSFVISPDGSILAKGKVFEEDAFVITLNTNHIKNLRLLDPRLRETPFYSSQNEPPCFPFVQNLKIEDPRNLPEFKGKISEEPGFEEEIYKALITGLKDYFFKNGFRKAVLGLSGGIDSSLTACIAVDALGAENVLAIFMPSEFTSRESYEDARELAKNLNINLIELPITQVFNSYKILFKEKLGYEDFSVADENIQARIRANFLFYLSNKEGYLVLSTSNKSESATGYTTIYGDMAGGFAPIKDVYKTLVYKLARYRNSVNPVIPERIFKKPPTAELKPGQRDQDVLPPYEVLDEILRLYLEEGKGMEEIAERIGDKGVVEKVLKMIRKAEYKRKQAPIGTKITKRAFGKDWRMPVTNAFVEKL